MVYTLAFLSLVVYVLAFLGAIPAVLFAWATGSSDERQWLIILLAGIVCLFAVGKAINTYAG